MLISPVCQLDRLLRVARETLPENDTRQYRSNGRAHPERSEREIMGMVHERRKAVPPLSFDN
jgi:hypothetical protein